MQKRFIIVLLPAIVILPSCIVGTSVAIHNRSGEDKNIETYYPAGLRPPLRNKEGRKDSLPGYDLTLTEGAITTRDYYRYPVKIPVRSLDTARRTYAFTLKAGHKVILEEGYPSFTPPFGQTFIMDKMDTIVLTRKGKHFRKFPKAGKGGSWIYAIPAREQ